jgi:hypothetical protein
MGTYVNDRGNEDEYGRPEQIILELDDDGDVRLSFDEEHDTVWIRPADLLGALCKLGVIAASKPRKLERETPSDRIRASWREAAAEAGRADVQKAENARSVRQWRTEIRRATETHARRPRFFQDADGDVWREVTPGRVALYRQSGMRVSRQSALNRERVNSLYGPLREVPDPYGVTRGAAAVAAVERLRDQVRDDVQRIQRSSIYWGR